MFFMCIPALLKGIEAFSIKHFNQRLLSGVLDNVNRFGSICFVLIFLCWIPAFFCAYPGILSYDVINQIQWGQWGWHNNFHPILHTYIIKLCLRCGVTLLGSASAGVAIYTVTQMLVLSFALAQVPVNMRKAGVPNFFTLAVIAFFALSPVTQMFAVSMVKDSLWAAFFILFCLSFAKLIAHCYPGKPPKTLVCKEGAMFIISAFFMCALRNNGIYIYIASIVLCLLVLIINAKFRSQSIFCPAILFMIPCVLWYLYTSPVFNALNVTRTNPREAVNLPIQQMGRVIDRHRAEFDEELKKIAQKWFVVENANYYPFNADFAKNAFNGQYLSEDPVGFVKDWLRLGMDFPKSYIAAALSNTLEFWYPKASAPGFLEWDNYPEQTLPIEVSRRPLLFGFLDKYYRNVAYNTKLRDLVPVNIFFTAGYSFAFLLIGIYIVIVKTGKDLLPMIALAPIFAQFCVMLLSPYASIRYAWPFYLSLPIFLIVTFQGRIAD